MGAWNRRCVWLLIAAIVGGGCAGCRQDGEAQTNAAASARSTSLVGEQTKSGEVLVLAAASTQNVVALIVEAYAERNKSTIRVSPGPSSGLAGQILAGAPADLFLSASREWAAQVSAAGLAAASDELLTNELVLIVSRGNPAGIKSPQDLNSEKLGKLALAGEKVPAGKYADQALAKLELLEPLTSQGKIARAQDVRGALSFVARGEAEAGIVYSTDVEVQSEVEVVHTFDPALHDEIMYVLVLLKTGADNPAAISFFEHLRSGEADDEFRRAGFRRIAARATDE